MKTCLRSLLELKTRLEESEQERLLGLHTMSNSTHGILFPGTYLFSCFRQGTSLKHTAEVEGRGATVVGQQGPPTAAPSCQRAESPGHGSRTTEVLLAVGAGLIL